MSRYYDIDKLKQMIEAKADTLIEGKEAFLYVAKWIDFLPTADVVPRAEVERLQSAYTEQNKALAKYIQSSADLVSHAKAEVAREIFEELDGIKKEFASGDINGSELFFRLYVLEKKYTEGQT